MRIFVDLPSGGEFPFFVGCADSNGDSMKQFLTYVHDLGALRTAFMQEAFEKCDNLVSVEGRKPSPTFPYSPMEILNPPEV